MGSCSSTATRPIASNSRFELDTSISTFNPFFAVTARQRHSSYVRELQTLSRPAEISRDVREERFVEHTLQIAIKAALHVASSRRGEPRGRTLGGNRPTS